MNVETSEENGIGRARLEGALDGKTAPEVREQLRPFLAANSKLILDLTKVDYLSSAGLRLLLLVYRELSAKKGKLVLLGVSEDIRTVMSHTGFLNFFTLAASEGEAAQALSEASTT
jgi:anti-sigma B factor antagonist